MNDVVTFVFYDLPDCYSEFTVLNCKKACSISTN